MEVLFSSFHIGSVGVGVVVRGRCHHLGATLVVLTVVRVVGGETNLDMGLSELVSPPTTHTTVNTTNVTPPYLGNNTPSGALSAGSGTHFYSLNLHT